MTLQFIKFFINGGLIGVASIFFQSLIYTLLKESIPFSYAISTALTYVSLVFINFQAQRKLIFYRKGVFLRFLISNFLIMVLVSLLSPVMRNLIDILVGPPLGDRMGFFLAAMMGSIPSFILSKKWVYALQPDQNKK